MCIETKLSTANRPSSENVSEALSGDAIKALSDAQKAYKDIPLNPEQREMGVNYRSLDSIQECFIRHTNWMFQITTQIIRSEAAQVVARATLNVVGKGGLLPIVSRTGLGVELEGANASPTTAALLKARSRLFAAIGMPTEQRVEIAISSEELLRRENMVYLTDFLNASKMKPREVLEAASVTPVSPDKLSNEDLALVVAHIKKTEATEVQVKEGSVVSEEPEQPVADKAPVSDDDMDKVRAKVELHLEDVGLTLVDYAKKLDIKIGDAKNVADLGDELLKSLAEMQGAFEVAEETVEAEEL